MKRNFDLPPHALASHARIMAMAGGCGVPNGLLRFGEIQSRGRMLAVNASASDRPRNDTETASAVRALTDGLTDFRANFETRLNAIENEMTANETGRLGALINGSGGELGLPVDASYTNDFVSYITRGAADAEASLKSANTQGMRAAIQAAMSVADNSSGGYLAPVEWDRQIHKLQLPLSPIRSISQVVTTGQAAYSTLWNSGAWASGWVGETAARPTTTTATLTPLTIPSGEIYAMPTVTQRLLDDAAINFEEWLALELAQEFSRQEEIAFVSGDGVNKPMGFLRYKTGDVAELTHPGGTLGITPSTNASSIVPDALVDMKYNLGALYRQNAKWVMNSLTAAIIAKMKDGQNNYIWREGLAIAEPPTLLGSPVVICEGMPNVAANAFPIAFGDFASGYLVNDRIGIRTLRDPYTAKPFVLFYSTKRVGGGVQDPNAIRLMKIAAS